jgi:hypothetical protein
MPWGFSAGLSEQPTTMFLTTDGRYGATSGAWTTGEFLEVVYRDETVFRDHSQGK